MKTTLPLNLIIGASVIIAGGGGFFAGTKYQQSKQSTQTSPFAAQFGRGSGMMRDGNFPYGQNQRNTNGAGPGQNSGRMGFRPVSGEIIASDDKSITVKMPDGSSKIVLISNSTSINKAASATKTDLVIGTTVAVFGQSNNDGSVTAQSIQLNPEFRGQEVSPQGGQPVNGQGSVPIPAPVQ